MSQPAIIEKLKRELRREISAESQVVYILVEIRKFLESSGEWKEYKALCFYCSWAVHTRMTKEFARRLLRNFDEIHPLLKDHALEDLPMYKAISDMISMREFWEQLKDFLAKHRLPNNIANGEWTAFLHLYASVIEDCPLTIKSANDPLLKNIQQVVLSLDTAPKKIEHAHGDYLLYRLRWTIYGKDGGRGSLFSFFTIP